jgi:hypothetical protein
MPIIDFRNWCTEVVQPPRSALGKTPRYLSATPEIFIRGNEQCSTLHRQVGLTGNDNQCDHHEILDIPIME